MGFGLVLARPSQNKLIWFTACVVVCCGVETKYTISVVLVSGVRLGTGIPEILK